MHICIISTIIQQNSTIFKTIEDETTISGQKIVGALQARRIAQQQATAQLEIDIACLKKYEIECQKGTVSTEQFDAIMDKASVSAKEYTTSINAGTGSAKTYAQAQKENNVALQSVGVGANIASKAVKLLSVAMNTIAFTAIISGITWLIDKVDEWIITADEAKESADAFKQSLSDFFNESNSNLKTITSLSDRFNELSKNVDSTGKQIGGTKEEYDEFLNICNQVKDIMPDLVSGYTAEGDAIITLKGKVDSLTESYKNAIRYKAISFLENGDEEGNTIDSLFEDYNNYVNGTAKLLSSTSFKNTEDAEEKFGYETIHEWLSSVSNATLEELQNLQVGTTKIVYLAEVLRESGYEISKISADNYNIVHDVLSNKLASMEQSMSERENNIRNAIQEMFYSDADYWDIEDENVVNAVNKFVNSIDKAFIDNNNLSDPKFAKEFVSNFVNSINQNEEYVAKAIGGLFSSESTIEQIEKSVKDLSKITGIKEDDIARIYGIFDLSQIYKKMLSDASRKATDSIRGREKQHEYQEIYAKLDEFGKQYSINTIEEIDAFNKALDEAEGNINKAFEIYLKDKSEREQVFITKETLENVNTYQSELKSLYEALNLLRSGEMDATDIDALIDKLASKS